MTTQDWSAEFKPVLLEKERLDDLLEKLPEVAGLRRLPVHYTCFDVKEPWTALGSNVGLVCIYNSQKNRLFQLHEIKHTITVVRLSLELNCLAYGSQDGVLRIIFFNQLATEPSDALVREAQQHSVTALEWNKHRLFSGFSSGKVLMTTVKLNKNSCATGLLLQTGSHVIQLTSCGHHLLVCTLASSFILQYVTGKLSQIGHQDRKAGPYGACFSTEPDNIFVARPGLRLWKAQASTGTVISTSKYRETLTLHSTPIIPLLGVHPSHPVITDRTQFTLLHLWCDKFVITHCQHALWVLDPSSTNVIATLAERLPIIDIICYKDSVYLLRPDKYPIIKLTVHADFKKATPPTSVISGNSGDLSSTLDSGSYQLSTEEPLNDNSSKPRTRSSLLATNTSPMHLPLQDTSQRMSQSMQSLQDDSKTISLAEMSVEDRLHNLHPSLPDVQSSSIAVQSVLKKKKKKKRKTGSHYVADSPVSGHHDDDESDITSTPTQFEGKATIGHVEVDANLNHTHPEIDKATVTDNSHAQFNTDDVSTHTNQEIVATSNSDITHTDQEVVATSNSDMITHTDNEVVATSNSNEVLYIDKDVVVTGNSDTMQSHDTCDGGALSTLTRNEEDYKMTREAVGYHIERLQEDQELVCNSAQQPLSEAEHTNQDDIMFKHSNIVTKDENVTSINTLNEEEAITSDISSQDDKVNTTGKRAEKGKQEDTIHPFLPEQMIADRQESITNADFTSLFKKCIDDMATKRREHRKELFGAVSPQPKDVSNQLPKEPAKEDKQVDTDIWIVTPSCPSKLGVKRIAATDKILWAMDSRGSTYWYSLDNGQWHTEKQSMEHISSSPSGSVLWGVYKGQPYVRLGITESMPQGKSWQKVDHELVKLLAVGESCVWTVNQDDKLMRRQGINLKPEGFQWEHTELKANFAKSISFCDEVLWACDKMGTVYALNTASSLLHVAWETVSGCLLESISLTNGGVIWGVEQQLGNVFFRCGVAPADPCGIGSWWEVNTAQPVSEETSLAGALANKVTSVVPGAITNRIDSISNRFTNSLPMSFIKNTIGSFIDPGDSIKKITTSSQIVWVLDRKGVVRYCRSVVTGSRYIPVSSLELMKVSQWSQVSALSTVPLDQGGLVWALRSTKELFYFDKEGTVKQIEYPPSVIKQVASSVTAVWIVTNKGLYTRDNVSKQNPQGTGWTKVDMGLLQSNEPATWLSCGKKVAWLVDSTGSVFMRVGVHNTVEALAQAWIEVDPSFTMAQVVVGTEDWLVWACDTHHNVYVRSGISDDFPIGNNWEMVHGCKAINLCCSSDYVWALCPGGDLLCRFGVKRNNVMGDYWKCITGHFCNISATLCGQLWVINENGQLLKRVTRMLNVSKSASKPQTFGKESTVEMEKDWDFI